ncbi:LOW QUALITY PROTEIN: xylose repressor, partial [Nocardioidaceae bacterium Broad-1]
PSMTVRSEPAQHAGMRASNLALVLGEVARTGPVSRARVAARTGLTKSSVSGLVADLISAGLIGESGPAATERGRPATALSLAPGGTAGLGLEINVDYLAAMVTDLTGAPRYHHVVRRDNRDREVDEVVADLVEVARTAAGSGGRPGSAAGGGLRGGARPGRRRHRRTHAQPALAAGRPRGRGRRGDRARRRAGERGQPRGSRRDVVRRSRARGRAPARLRARLRRDRHRWRHRGRRRGLPRCARRCRRARPCRRRPGRTALRLRWPRLPGTGWPGSRRSSPGRRWRRWPTSPGPARPATGPLWTRSPTPAATSGRPRLGAHPPRPRRDRARRRVRHPRALARHRDRGLDRSPHRCRRAAAAARLRPR